MCQTRAHFVEVQLTTVTDRVTILVEPVSPQQISSCLERAALTRTAASKLIALRHIYRVERLEGVAKSDLWERVKLAGLPQFLVASLNVVERFAEHGECIQIRAGEYAGIS